MPSVPNLPSRTSKFILSHPEYYNYVRLNGNGGASGDGAARRPPASGAGKDCQDSSTAGTEPPAPPTTTPKPSSPTSGGNRSDVVIIGGGDKKGSNGQVDDDDDFLSAAAAIVRTNTPASPTNRPVKLQSTTPRSQHSEDDEPLELEVVDAVDSAGTMASRNGTLTVTGKVAQSRKEDDDDEEEEEDAEESGRLERVALVERVDPKLGLSLGEAPRKAKITVFRRERSG
ncbi:uncharacterized protein LOC127751850 [Frankliniella occidentalis]|uniref:Uncharacterized protein LOC127751850 n=1 Tax=Frankliniella occidentalis TaxID=133901 RepID=A0A9C6XAB7_FRAOC|nr:uncharacterized protein LOC127751850 [Frankliniella occidentalis]